MQREKIRLFVEADLDIGAGIAATAAQAHYLSHVMRKRSGATVRLFNGRDGEFATRIERIQRGRCEMRVERRIRPQRAEPGPALVFAPIKKDAVDFLAVKATELGAARLTPVLTRFTAATRINVGRLAANAIEAAEQCGRLTVPAIDTPRPLHALLAAWPSGRRLWVCDAASGGRAAGAAFAPGARPPGRDPAPMPGLLIGPEGGLAEDELDALRALPFVNVVCLGPRILRAETAAVAALACWQALAGDWTDPCPGETDR